ncbi:MAG TPA: polysaccharide biosynthesis C-terminal domain-containing protein [Bacteroidota bacterium]|nr:polysaccharide biosynthesis C-terminal domain-containing protein [Bacteroidota bacterium]
MREQLRRLGTDTATYGISTIVGRFLNFLLVPLYTNILLPAELGIVTYVYSIIAFANVLYSYGMESAYFKYSTSKELGSPKQNFSVPFISLFSTSILFSCIILALHRPIAGALNLDPGYHSVILYAAGIMAFDALAIIPFASLRLERKAKLFAAIKVLNILLNVALNIVLLVVLKMGVVGVFISGLAASGFTLILLLPTVFRHLSREAHMPLLKALLKFALPYVPAGLATQAIQVIDRPIMRSLTNDATVGIYQANYRLGIFMMLIVQMFDFAWRPFYFSIAGDSNAKQIFARVLTYLVLLMSGIFLVLTLFIGDAVKISILGHHLIHPAYWGGLSIVPIVLLAYLFLGVSNNFSAGIYIEKKTKYLPMITFVGAIVNVAANYLLIPSLGIVGAAWATLFAYLVMAIALYLTAQRVYPVAYEFGRLMKIGAAVAAVMVLYAAIPTDSMSIYAAAALKSALIVLFLALMYVMKFFAGSELSALRSLFVKMKPARTKADDTGEQLPLE